MGVLDDESEREAVCDDVLEPVCNFVGVRVGVSDWLRVCEGVHVTEGTAATVPDLAWLLVLVDERVGVCVRVRDIVAACERETV